MIDLARLRFRKREGYYSMGVSGFILDKVKKVEMASQSGNIPLKWFELSGWDKDRDEFSTKHRFNEFWRTLVADRSTDGRNPPTYYARACKMSLRRGLGTGALDTTGLIDNCRCSVVANFFRRVQSVICKSPHYLLLIYLCVMPSDASAALARDGWTIPEHLRPTIAFQLGALLIDFGQGIGL